jgi:hypothetical protein
MSPAHHVPMVMMIHALEQPLSQMFSAVVAHNQHGRNRKHERSDDHGHPRFGHSDLLLRFRLPAELL